LSDLSFAAADTIAPADLHAAFVAAFSDYIAGPFQVPPDQWDHLLARPVVDLAASRVGEQQGGGVLFGVARQPGLVRDPAARHDHARHPAAVGQHGGDRSDPAIRQSPLEVHDGAR